MIKMLNESKDKNLFIKTNQDNPINPKIERIGLLDSGVGGLSVLSQLYKIMPDKNYIFFGDTKNLPYGTKTGKEIFKFTKEILEFFIAKNVKNAIIACNTTSAVAYDELREYFKNRIKIFPLIQLCAPCAVDNLKENDTIAVLATKATVNSGKYRSEIHKINNKINVLELDCTGFVEIVENRLYKEESSIELIKSKLEIAKKHNAKKIILGCTHYPYLESIFRKIYDVEYFNPAVEIAKIVKNEIKTPDSKHAGIDFCVSGAPLEFKLSAKMFFDIKSDIEVVDLSKSLV